MVQVSLEKRQLHRKTSHGVFPAPLDQAAMRLDNPLGHEEA